MIETTHVLIRTLIGENGETVRACYFGSMTDSEFQEWFINPRREVPQGWKIVHIPMDEIRSGSRRVDLIRAMPIVLDWTGGIASWKNDLRVEFGL